MSNTELETIKTPAKRSAAPVWRRPLYSVNEDAEAFHVRVDVPGVKKSGVDISVDQDILSLTAARKDAVPSEWRPLRRELPAGDYRLNLRLNVPVDESQISAKVTDGVLELTLPKAEEVKPRKIAVD